MCAWVRVAWSLPCMHADLHGLVQLRLDARVVGKNDGNLAMRDAGGVLCSWSKETGLRNRTRTSRLRSSVTDVTPSSISSARMYSSS